MQRVCLTMSAAVMMLALPGCVITDINDGIVLANSNLESINASFEQVEKANELLASIGSDLDRLDERVVTLQARMDSVDERLTTLGVSLGSVDSGLGTTKGQLDQVEVHLASLRKTINNIDSVVPFLRISGDDKEDKDALEAGAAPAPLEVVPAPVEDAEGPG